VWAIIGTPIAKLKVHASGERTQTKEAIGMRNTWTDTVIQGSMVVFGIALGLLALTGLTN
jgi:hypothetical protein